MQVTGSGDQLLSRTTGNPFLKVTVKHLLPAEKQRQGGIPKRQCIRQNLLGEALGILYQKFQPKERGNEENGNLKVHHRSPEWPPSHLAALHTMEKMLRLGVGRMAKAGLFTLWVSALTCAGISPPAFSKFLHPLTLGLSLSLREDWIGQFEL